MTTGRPRILAALLTLALGAGTVAGAGMPGSAARAEGAISGTYRLDSTSIWAGQQVTLTQAALEDGTPETAPRITVDWGDSTSSDLEGAKATHSYAAAGSYTVRVTLTDDGATTPGTLLNATSVVTVAAAGGTFKFNPAWNWTWPGGGHEATLQLSGVPAETTRLWVNWGDGNTSLVQRTRTSVKHHYAFGTYTASVTLENAQGRVTKPAGTYSLRADTAKPSSSLKVPISPTKASSWKTVQGTAKDAQTGMDAVGVQLWKWKGAKEYYYHFSRSEWIRYTEGATRIPAAAIKWVPVSSAGVWKVKVAGLSKGYYLEVDYTALDRAGNANGPKYRVQRLTR
ncbi:PKD domain-containing protein [Couchioplanes caeruleus]|uniref:PKD domain-containing protein n=2 Tax=Couchioplanes caeruleus TaxID=56438 RepID=A0A1K0FY31_9ACTN|nr:PKD domain-containing protein [Couchioplanes caeruleus]OJF09978.1 hypothetical protein BG844_34370 [Couchioplanes caeruleus subsp. caeruleus]ROP31690.1 PKD domain-containing protein [Couchioplanes caeruleus]